MTRLRILDLYCGAGLVADGLKAAGWDVVGVDLFDQPRYPGPFIKADALGLDQRFIRSFDAVWASPPCQFGTALRHAPNGKQHLNLIPATRELLQASGLPYVIENVESPAVRACMVDPVRLCGSMFGLGVTAGGVTYQLRRHRLFETNWPLPELECAHRSPVIGIYGGHARNRAAKAGGRGTADFVGLEKRPLMLGAMGLADRGFTTDEISQGVPPAFSEFIAIQLRRHITAQRRAA